jgi:hypothetical protein
MDPRIRIHTKMLWIRNTATRPASPARTTSSPPGGQTSRGNSGQISAIFETQVAVPEPTKKQNRHPQRSKIQRVEYPRISRTLRLDPGLFSAQNPRFRFAIHKPLVENLRLWACRILFLKDFKNPPASLAFPLDFLFVFESIALH